jgi:hypothetical protein
MLNIEWNTTMQLNNVMIPDPIPTSMHLVLVNELWSLVDPEF